MFNIMIVEDDIAAGKVIEFELKSRGHACRCFKNAEEALVYFAANTVDLALLDYTLPGMNGEEFYKKILELNPMTPVIFMTAVNSVDKAVQLMKMGAFSYLTKPLDLGFMHDTVKQALEKRTLEKETGILRETVNDGRPGNGTETSIIGDNVFGDYVFDSPRMKEILRIVRRVAGSGSNVLITGESGTGKEVIANLLHQCSPRKNRQMVKVNLSALPHTLIESELFGSVKGAYTGASANRPGKFEEAHNGTLFLDEIGELSMDIQVKLLRVIQDREVTRLGSNKSSKMDIRLITATNKNLMELTGQNKFREDLFYRLNVIDIEMPPLRERKQDIPLLIDLFITKSAQREKKNVNRISSEAMDILMKYRFPGNIRELENIIERAVVLTEREMLCGEDLPVFILNSRGPEPADTLAVDSRLSLAQQLSAVEKNILEKTLKKHHFHQSNAARELGISEGCLRYKIKTLGIPKNV